MKIRIENPTPGGARFTSLAQAESYVRDGRARLSPDRKRLHFLDMHQHRSAELNARELADQAWRLSTRGYDSRGMLSQREVRGIPVVMAYRLFL